MNILYLVLNNLIDSPILYLSKYINKTKQEYYKLFNEVRNNNNLEDWILYILKGIEITSKETITLIEKIQQEQVAEKLKVARQTISKWELGETTSGEL